MKILITTDLYTVKTNGVVTSLQNLFDEMKRRGHDVKILTISDNKKSKKDEINNVYYIGSSSMEWVYPGIRAPRSYRGRLIKEIIEWKPDVIHSQCEFFSYFFALRISRKTGAKIVHTYHTMYEDYATYVIKFSKKLAVYGAKKFSQNRLKRSAWVIAPTQKVSDLLNRYKIKLPISVIPTGISLDQHKQRLTKEERDKKRAELGFSESDVVMMTLGRLGYEKNVDELINYLYKAKKHAKNLKFLIVGDGPARDELLALRESLKLSEEIVFTGKVPPTEVQSYYQLGDLFVSASTSETQGLTYIEAAANALPLLCRDDPCLDNVIERGVNGYAYTTEDEFLTHLEAIANDGQWRISASQSSEEISKKFDKRVFGDSVEEIYNQLINQTKKATN